MTSVSEPTIYEQLIFSLAKHIEREYPVTTTYQILRRDGIPGIPTKDFPNTLTLWYKGTPYAGLDFYPDQILVNSGPRYTDNWLRTARMDYADPTLLDQIHAILSAVEF